MHYDELKEYLATCQDLHVEVYVVQACDGDICPGTSIFIYGVGLFFCFNCRSLLLKRRLCLYLANEDQVNMIASSKFSGLGLYLLGCWSGRVVRHSGSEGVFYGVAGAVRP